MRDEMLGVYLELLATKSRALSEEVKRGKTWPGDVTRGLREIRDALDKADDAARGDR